MKAYLSALALIWGPWCLVYAVPSSPTGGEVLARSETAVHIWLLVTVCGFPVAVLFTILSVAAITLAPLVED